MKRNELLHIQILHSHLHAVWGNTFLSVDKTEPSTELYMSFTT